MNVSEITPRKEDDVSTLIQIKQPENTTSPNTSQIRLKDAVNKRKLRNQRDLRMIDLADDNSPGLDG